MDSVSQVSSAMQFVMGDCADRLAQVVGFVKRRSKMTGAKFVQTLVFGWLANAASTLEELAQTAAAVGVRISSQGMDQRFTLTAARFLQELLECAVCQVVASTPVMVPLLQRFNGVYVQDSSTIALPDTLADHWQGCNGRTQNGTMSAVKMQVRIDLNSGALNGPILQDGRRQDQLSPHQTALLPSGALRLADLGYFNLQVMANLQAQSVYWLSRLKVGTVIADDRGQRRDLLQLIRLQESAQVDLPILLGAKLRIPCRLIAMQVSPEVASERRRKLHARARRKGQAVSRNRLALTDWTLFVTNAPAEMLNSQEAVLLGRARWQIELLFKLWKSHGLIDEWRTENPSRILCELYGKLIAMVVQH